MCLETKNSETDNTPIVTVLTPTYNRANQLISLWKSLCEQTNLRFVWIVVDDGSRDNTETVMQDIVRESTFKVKYIKKGNGGKHTAVNAGVALAQTPLVFIVDSDDTLTCDAIETIVNNYEIYKNDVDICGFSFLRAFPNGEINGRLFPKDEWKESYINARINTNDMMSDKAEVYKTICLREFPFPEFEGEKFLGEDIVWIRMARKYKTVHINKAIYIGEYRADGLTVNRRRHNLNSPNGCTERAKEYLKKDICLKHRIKGTLQYLIYGRVAKNSYINLLGDAPNKFMCLVMTFPALIIQMSWCNSIYRLRK